MIAKKLFKVSFPLVLSMSSGLIMMLVDRITLAKYSSETLAASGPAIFTLMTFIMFFTGAISILRTFVAQRVGKKEIVSKNYLIGCIRYIFALCIAFAVLIPVIFLLPIVSGRPENIILLEMEYLRYGVFYAIFMIFNAGATSVLNGLALTKYVLLITLIGQIVNVILTPTLVFGLFGFPELGMSGSSAATMVSNIIMCCVICFIFTRVLHFQNNEKDMVPRANPFLKIGLPAGASSGLDELANTAFIWVIGLVGIHALVSLNTALLVNYVLIVPLIGLAVGVSILTAEKIGASDFSAVVPIFKLGLMWSFIYVFLSTIFVLIGADWILSVLSINKNTEFYAASKLTLLVLWTYPPAFSISFIASQVLSSFGDTKFTLNVRLIMTFIFSIPVIYLIVKTAEIDMVVAEAWVYGAFIELVIGGIYTYRIYKNVSYKRNFIGASR